jgi:hypothetical protein
MLNKLTIQTYIKTVCCEKKNIFKYSPGHMSIYTMPPVVDQYAILNCLLLHLHLVLWKLLLDLSYLVTRIKHSVHYILFILKSIKGVVWLFYIRVSIISIWKNDVQPKISYVFLKRFETRNCLSPYSTPSIYAFWLIIHVKSRM